MRRRVVEKLQCGAVGEVAEFAGDVATTARLTDGPIVDLNLMTVRGKASGVMTHCNWPSVLPVCEMLVAVTDEVEITVDGRVTNLSHQDAFLDAHSKQIVLRSGSVAHITLAQ